MASTWLTTRNCNLNKTQSRKLLNYQNRRDAHLTHNLTVKKKIVLSSDEPGSRPEMKRVFVDLVPSCGGVIHQITALWLGSIWCYY